MALPGIINLTVKITGVVPLLCHNGRTVDPCDVFARKLKELNGTRKKTDEIYEKIARVEFEAGLYFDDKGQPSIPGVNIESTLISAAKKSKDGPRAKAGLFTTVEYVPIEYTGPRDVDAMWEQGSFRHRAKVKIGQSSIIRTRPMFRTWSMTIPVQVESDILNAREVEQFFDVAGRVIGLGDWRPRYGRFMVEDFREE